MTHLTVRPLEQDDIPTVVEMEHAAWHEYYSQYTELYALIKDSVTIEKLRNEWQEFLSPKEEIESRMVLGDDRICYVAFCDDQPIGIGAASAYTHGLKMWEKVDNYIFEHNSSGKFPKIVKYQNLYVHANHRGKGVGHYLNLFRADAMLEKGYTGIFLAPFADAHKTMSFHKKNGLEHIHTYPSQTIYGDGQHVNIACFVNLDLADMRNHWQSQLDAKIAANRAFTLD